MSQELLVLAAVEVAFALLLVLGTPIAIYVWAKTFAEGARARSHLLEAQTNEWLALQSEEAIEDLKRRQRNRQAPANRVVPGEVDAAPPREEYMPTPAEIAQAIRDSRPATGPTEGTDETTTRNELGIDEEPAFTGGFYANGDRA